MSDYNFEKLEIAVAKVEEVRKLEVDILNEYGAVLPDNATLAECANAIGTVVQKAQSFYRCLTSDTTAKTWTGRRGAFATDGNWVYDEKPSDLQYTYIAPEEGSVYSSDAIIRVLSINCDPRFLDIFWRETWETDPIPKKVENIKEPITGTITTIYVPQPTTATKVQFWYGVEPKPENFGIKNDVAREATEAGQTVSVPGGDMACVALEKTNTKDAACLYAVVKYGYEEESPDIQVGSGPAVLKPHRRKFGSKDFSFFCWYKGNFRSGDTILSFVAPEGTPPNAPFFDLNDPGNHFCMRFSIFSHDYNSWKPGFSDNNTAYGSDIEGWKGDLYHDLKFSPAGSIYNSDYWHQWGCTYNHVTGKLRGYFDGKEIGEYSIETDFQKSVMDIADCTVLVGCPGSSSGIFLGGESILSGTCFTQEQIEYLYNKTQNVTKSSPRINAKDQSFDAVVDEWSEMHLKLQDNFSGSTEFDGKLVFAADGMPDWITPYFGTDDLEGNGFFGAPPSAGTYTFTVTISGEPPEGYPPPSPVTITITINARVQ